jgi:hypothetical protein
VRLSDRGVRVAVAGPSLVAMLVALVWIGSAWSTAGATVALPVCASPSAAPFSASPPAAPFSASPPAAPFSASPPAAQSVPAQSVSAQSVPAQFVSARSVSTPSVTGSCLKPVVGRLIERPKNSPRHATEWGVRPDGAAYVSGAASFPMSADGDLGDARGSQVTGLFRGGQLAGVQLADHVAWSSDAAETRILLGPFLLLMASVLFSGLVLYVAVRRGRSPGRDSLAMAVPGCTLLASFALGVACGWGAGLVLACSIWLGLWFGLLALSRRSIRARSRSATIA